MADPPQAARSAAVIITNELRTAFIALLLPLVPLSENDGSRAIFPSGASPHPCTGAVVELTPGSTEEEP
jgi:hypothetical protein